MNEYPPENDFDGDEPDNRPYRVLREGNLGCLLVLLVEYEDGTREWIAAPEGHDA